MELNVELPVCYLHRVKEYDRVFTFKEGFPVTLVEIDLFGTVTKVVLGNQLMKLQEKKQVETHKVLKGNWLAAFIGNAN